MTNFKKSAEIKSGKGFPQVTPRQKGANCAAYPKARTSAPRRLIRTVYGPSWPEAAVAARQMWQPTARNVCQTRPESFIESKQNSFTRQNRLFIFGQPIESRFLDPL